MSHFAPFTVYFRVIPLTPYTGKRFETIRDLQKTSVLIYTLLTEEELSPPIRVSHPGGGQQQLNHGGHHANGCAIKPQFGNIPAQIVVTGVVEQPGSNVSPHGTKQIISGGQVYTGKAPTPYLTPDFSAEARTELINLRTAIETKISTYFGDYTDYNYDAYPTLYRIRYKGVTWGSRGNTFPLVA